MNGSITGRNVHTASGSRTDEYFAHHIKSRCPLFCPQINTIPQGVIDMNQCTDVVDAEEITGHQLSAAIVMSERSTYFKGTTKDETTRYVMKYIVYDAKNKK